MTRFFYLILLFSTIVVNLSSAQSNDLSAQVPDIKAEKLYSRDGYQCAIDIYEKEDPKNQNRETQLKIANSYRLTGNTIMAEKYYSLCIDEKSQIQDVYNYAQVLLSNGKCKESLKYFDQYEKSAGTKNFSNIISSCDDITGFPINNHIQVTNAEGLNSKWLDFCPVYYQNGLIFTSGRPDNSEQKVKDFWSGKTFSDVYFASSKGDGKFETPGILSWNLHSQYHDGAVSFGPDGQTMYYSSNNHSGKNKKGIKDLKIYTAKFQNGGWVNTDPFPFNSDEYDNCHPALSADGNVLVFASDMPDGEGGMDLYVCFKRDNVWTKPINLGKQINTSGNEIFPFLDVKGTLYFSSNGLKGMGGLDIFSATKNGNEFFWTSPVNLGQPFNSIRDDLSYTGARSGQEGYFASNREGGLGEDDIYHWVLKPEYKGLSENLEGLIPISVVDKESALPIADAKVNLFNEKSESFAFLTNAEGKIGKEVTRKETKFIECEKDGYKPNHKFLTQEMVGNPSKSIIFLEPETYQPMRGNVVDRSTDQPIQDAEILITNLSTGEVRSLRSKSDGSYSTTLLCANDYKFSVTKPDYLKNEDDFHKNEILCRSDKSIIKDFHLTPYKINDKRKQLSAALLGNESEKFEAGRSFEVKDIYYDYNKFAIRKDAAKVLDKLVDLLKEFPEMEIELSSHTDSRGRDSYNQKLSQQRADSAVKYLIQKGIQASRLRAAGYGESLLKNNCEDGVNCSEDEHQINRRTEIKILKL